MGLFGRKRGGDQPQPEVYEGLRKQVLHLAAAQLGEKFAEAPILALFSNGGGIIGAGTHKTVADANARWLESGVAVLPRLSVITDPPLPGEGLTQFVAVTPQGLRGASAAENQLGEGRHELSPFFYSAQDVITQIRLTQGG